MAKEIGQLNVKIGLDSTGFQNGISSLNREMRKVQSEFRLASSEMGKHGKELDGLKLRSDSLTKQTELQRQKVEALKAAHQKSVETKGADAKATQDLEIKLNRAKTQLNYMEQDLKKLNREIEVQSSGWYKLSKSLEPIGKSMQDIGKKMEAVGKNLSMKVTAPLIGLGAAAVKVGSDFETGMSEVGAISGATGDDFVKLQEKAKEMGATTKFSATEASEGLKYMAMAGWDTSQMLDGLDGVMMLAAASGEDLGLVSDIVTDALTAFGMEAREASGFADLLASASSNSNTNVALLGESFKYVAPLFGALGYSAEDAALGLGLMANAGIKGSQAGTSLKTAIANLASPTKAMGTAMDQLGISITDANGQMLPFKGVMDELRGKFADLTEEQQAHYASTIFGKEAMSGMLAIINASEEDYAKLTDATRNYTGTAKEMADVMQDNLQGEIILLKSALEGVALQLYEAMLPALEKVVAAVQKAVDWFANLSPEVKQIIVVVAGLAAAVGPLLIVIGQMSIGMGAAIQAGSKLAGIFVKLTTPVGLVIAAIAGLIAAGVLLWKNWDTISAKAKEIWGSLKDFFVNIWGKIKNTFSTAMEWIKNLFLQYHPIGIIISQWDEILSLLKGLPSAMLNIGKGIMQGLFNGIVSVANNIITTVQNIANSISNTFKRILGIRSPSSVFEQYGKYIDEGLAKGIKDNAGTVLEQVQGVADGIKQTMEKNVNQLNKVGEAITTALKKQYEEQERIQTRALDRQVEAERKATDKKTET